MSHNFRSVVFTPLVQARVCFPCGAGQLLHGDCSSYQLALRAAPGWPEGLVKVVDDHTIAFADFGGDKQFVSTRNPGSDNRVALIMVDDPRQSRLKILGRVGVIQGVRAPAGRT